MKEEEGFPRGKEGKADGYLDADCVEGRCTYDEPRLLGVAIKVDDVEDELDSLSLLLDTEARLL